MLSIFLSIKRAIKGLLGPILARLIQFVLAHPALKAWALTFVFRYPMLEEWLYRFAVSKGLLNAGITIQRFSDPSSLTPKALLIYADLKAAIERQNRRDY